MINPVTGVHNDKFICPRSLEIQPEFDMALSEEFESQGNFLFLWRSYLPLAILVPMVVAMWSFQWPNRSHYLQEMWECVCIPVSIIGLLVRAKAVGHAARGTSGKNTRGQVAESVNTTGIYSVVRHPLYLGNFLIWLGIAMFALHWWFLAIFVLAFFLYYERIMFAEEAFLRRKFGKNYEDWASRTPALIPRLSQWERPSLTFSYKKFFRQEYSGFFGLVVAFFLLELGEHLAVDHRIHLEPLWLAIGSVGLAIYITLRSLKKHSTLLATDR